MSDASGAGGRIRLQAAYTSRSDRRQVMAHLLIALLPQLVIHTARAQEQADLLLTPPQQTPECMCRAEIGEGWSEKLRQCMRGLRTSCVACPHQKQCTGVTTVAGNGLAAFTGDCHYRSTPYYSPSMGAEVSDATCAQAYSAALSYPASIVLDADDNIYIADYRNNRVRMVRASRGTAMYTIAGSGETGFSDGLDSMARWAKLRRPEGVAVRRSPVDGVMEVFFSDVLNQRIRRVREPSSAGGSPVDPLGDWTIDTVLGTGEQGSNPECDIGCLAAPSLGKAILNNPRALTFSEAKDLYIIDSGNRKIMRLSADLDMYKSFVGATVKNAVQGIGQTASQFLPGQFSQDNQYVSLQNLNSMAIDRFQNLWFADSTNNRIFMAPTSMNRSIRADGLTGLILEFYRLHFLTNFSSVLYYQDDVEYGVGEWLVALGKIPVRTAKSYSSALGVNYELGKSYWRYGLGLVDDVTWCRDVQTIGRSKCNKVVATEAPFMGIKGMCFNRANQLFLADGMASEVTKINDRTSFMAEENEGAFKTTNGCQCSKYWLAGMVLKLGEFDPASCKQAMGNETGGIEYPDCTVTNYCSAEDGELVPWCYINTSADVGNVCAGSGNRPRGYCKRYPAPVSWTEAPYKTLLGSEIRVQKRLPIWQDRYYYNVVGGITEDDLWYWNYTDADCLESSDKTFDPIPKWSILLGFQHVSFTNPPSGGWCNGLDDNPTPTPLSIHSTDWFTKQFTYSYDCKITNSSTMALLYSMLPVEPVPNWYYLEQKKIQAAAADESAIYAPPSVQTDLIDKGFDNIAAMLIWSSPDTLEVCPDATGPAPCNFRCYDQQECKNRCWQDPNCKAFMMEWDNDDGEHLATTKCRFYSDVMPYQVFLVDRVELAGMGINATVSLNYTEEELEAAREAYTTPIVPWPRLYSTGEGIGLGSLYLSVTNPWNVPNPNVIPGTGPNALQSLVWTDCMVLCFLNADCYGIAFPGCYLLSQTGSMAAMNPNEPWTAQNRNEIPMQSPTVVYIKKNPDETLTGVAGYPRVNTFKGALTVTTDAFGGEGQNIDEAYLNGPMACGFDSAGKLYVTDSWNQRVRRVEDMSINCVYDLDRNSKADVLEYITLTQYLHANCTATPSMKAKFEMAQKQSLASSSDTEFLERFFCDHQTTDWADADWNSMYPSPLNMIAICQACDSIYAYGNTSRSGICPCEEMCQCRSTVNLMMQNNVYMRCGHADAVFDMWHKWITVHAACFWKGGRVDAISQLNVDYQEELKTDILEYTGPSNEMCSK